MKKTLAILLVALVALTSVFAGTRTLTLTNTVQDAETTFDVLYGKTAGNLNKLVDQENDPVDLVKGTEYTRHFAVTIKANSSQNASNMYVRFDNTPFLHENAPEENVPANMQVATTLNFTAKNDVKGVSTIITSPADNSQQVNVTYTQFNKIDDKVVATGTLTWTNNQDLVAGNYISTVTVTISTND